MIRTLYEDVRFALRVLGKAKGYTAAAILTLALAIGVNTAIFSVVNGTLLRPLPYADPDELVMMWERSPSLENMSISYLDLVDWRARQKSFTGVAGYVSQSRALTGFTTPERIIAEFVSWDFFEVLGVRPMLGRTFNAAEDQPEAPGQVVILTHDLWVRRFGSDPGIVGRTVTLEGQPFSIIGVLPPSFRFQDDAEVFLPLAPIQKAYPSRGSHPGIEAVGRLKPGVTLAQAKQDMDSIGAQLEKEYPRDDDQLRPKLVHLQEELVKHVRPTLVLLMAAVVFVLLIAIANVANLTLARGTSRRREMAIRAALGASRGRLARQLLVESVVLGLGAGVLGVLIALWGVDLLAGNRPAEIPNMMPIAVDAPVLAFSFVASLVAGLLFGLLPAIQSSRTQLTDALKEGDLRTGSARGNKLRGVLVAAEVALAIVLLVGAGLSIRAFARLLDVDPGLDTHDLLTFRYKLPLEKYSSPEAIRGFNRQLEGKLRALPGVTAVTVSNGLPFKSTSQESFSFDGDPPNGSGSDPIAVSYAVQPGYFETMRIPILRGRPFTEADVAAGVQKIVVDEKLAARFLDPEDPFSKRFASKGPPDKKEPPIEIVGIARHVAQDHLDRGEDTPYEFYWLTENLEPGFYTMVASQLDVSIRTEVDPLSLTEAVRRTVTEIDPDLPIYDVKTMDQRFHAATAARRFAMVLLGLFAALALLIAAMGLYAVMGYMVSQRTREIGIRVALGAEPAQVRWMVVKQGVMLAGIGVVAGILGALALSKVLSRLVFGVEAKDPLTFVAVVVVLVVVALLSSYLPARRAARVDPMVALRYE